MRASERAHDVPQEMWERPSGCQSPAGRLCSARPHSLQLRMPCWPGSAHAMARLSAHPCCAALPILGEDCDLGFFRSRAQDTKGRVHALIVLTYCTLCFDKQHCLHNLVYRRVQRSPAGLTDVDCSDLGLQHHYWPVAVWGQRGRRCRCLFRPWYCCHPEELVWRTPTGGPRRGHRLASPASLTEYAGQCQHVGDTSPRKATST